MDTTYYVKVTSQAESQIQEILKYITHELKAPETALHLLDTLENAFASLKHIPQTVQQLSLQERILRDTGKHP